MEIGTAVFVCFVLYLLVTSKGFRGFALIIGVLAVFGWLYLYDQNKRHTTDSAEEAPK